MEKITLHLQLENDVLITFLKTFFRRAIPIYKPEEIRYNLKQAAAYVGESEKSLTRHAEMGLVARSHKGRGCTFEIKELDRYCLEYYKRPCLKKW
jgi:hypothetical protein